MIVGEVAPVAPAAAYGLAALGSLIAFIVCWGLLHAWKRTLGAIFAAVAGLSIKIPFNGRIRPFALVGQLNDQVVTYLGIAVVGTEHATTYLFNQMTAQTLAIGHEIAALAEATERALYAVAVKPVQRLEDAIIQDFRRKLKAIAAATAALGIDRLPGLERLVHEAWKILFRGIDRLEHGIVARITHAVDALEARVGIGARALPRLGKRVAALERKLTLAGAAALVVAALARLGLGFLRCRNVTKAGKSICGMNANLLESLLADTLLIAGSLSLVEFAHEMIAVTGESEDLIRTFWRAK